MTLPAKLWLVRSELIYIHAEKETQMNGGETIPVSYTHLTLPTTGDV